MMKHILAIGNDAGLLFTRRLVLQHAGVVVHVAPPREALDSLSHTPYDLLVLCHTLSQDEVETVLAEAEASLPRVKALLLGASSFLAGEAARRERFELREGPACLVRRVRELLAYNPGEEEPPRPLAPPPTLRLVPRPVNAPSPRRISAGSGGSLVAWTKADN